MISSDLSFLNFLFSLFSFRLLLFHVFSFPFSHFPCFPFVHSSFSLLEAKTFQRACRQAASSHISPTLAPCRPGARGEGALRYGTRCSPQDPLFRPHFRSGPTFFKPALTPLQFCEKNLAFQDHAKSVPKTPFLKTWAAHTYAKFC